MRILLQLVAFAILRLFSCAEVVQKTNNAKTLTNIALDEMWVITSFLDNPFSTLGALNRHFNTLFHTELSAKSVFKKRFNIPELVTDDVDENDQDLKRIILAFSKCTNPDQVLQGIRNEFLHYGKFKALAPNLIKYFKRFDFDSINDVLLERTKFDLVLECGLKMYELNIDAPFFKSIRNLQGYIVSNPQHLESIINYTFRSRDIRIIITNWVTTALIANMPDMIFYAFNQYYSDLLELSTPVRQGFTSVWTGYYIPPSNYPTMYNRINFLIDNVDFVCNDSNDSSSDDEIDSSDDDKSNNDGKSYSVGNLELETPTDRMRYLCRLLNLIRYGPDDSNIYEEKIQIKNLTGAETALMCHCASLANKMDLFMKLLPKTMYAITAENHCINFEVDNLNGDPIEIQKFLFDLLKYPDPPSRNALLNRKDISRYLSRYYRVVHAEVKDNPLELKFELKIAPDSFDLQIPETLAFTQKFTVKTHMASHILKFHNPMRFESAEVLERFLRDSFNLLRTDNDFEEIFTTENFNLFLRSELIRLWICQSIVDPILPCRHLMIKPNELVSYVELGMHIRAKTFNLDSRLHFPLHELKTSDQLRKLETLLGHSVSVLIRPYFNYHKHFHVFKYLIESGQPLPGNLSEETLALLRIDYPTLNLDL